MEKRVIICNVLPSKTGMPVARLMKLVDDNRTLKLHVRWKGLSLSDDTLELLARVKDDVPQLVLKSLDRKT